MKTITTRKLPIKLLAMFLLGLWLVPPATLYAAKPVVLKIATLSPDGTTWMKKMRTGAKEIANRTEGRVKFKFYPGGIMGNDESVLRKIRIRQLHGGAVVAGALAHIYPDIQIYTLPFLFESLEEVDYVRTRMDQQLIKGLEKKGFETFGFGEGGFGYLMAKAPVTTLDHLGHQKVWVQTGDEISIAMLEAAGVSPISLPIGDVLTGLQTGLINAITTSPIAAIALQWHTKVKYMTDAPLAYVYGLLAVDRKYFHKIGAADRVIVHEVMGKVFAEINRQNRLDNINALNALQQQGIEFLHPQQQQLNAWKSVAESTRDQLGHKGLYTETTLQSLLTHLTNYRDTQASTSGD